MATQYCTKCGSILPSDSPVCTECGTDSSKISVQGSQSMEYSAPLSFTGETPPVAPPVPEMAEGKEEVPSLLQDPLPEPPQPSPAPAESFTEAGSPQNTSQNYYQSGTAPTQDNQAPSAVQNTQTPPYQNTQTPPPSGFQQFNPNNATPQQKTNQNNTLLIGVLALVLSIFSPLFGVIAAILGITLSKKSLNPKPVRILCFIAIGISVVNFIISVAGSFLEIFLMIMD